MAVSPLLLSLLPVFSRGDSRRITGRSALEANHAALPIVRLILGITLLLVGIGSLSCQIDNPVGSAPAVAAGRWVRTVDGWERTDLWDAPERFVPQLHPFVVAAGQGLLSVWALVACTGNGRVRQVGEC